MSNNEFKSKIFKMKAKNSNLTINVPEASSYSKYKNLKLSNRKSIPINMNYKTINTSSINSMKNKNKNKLNSVLIPKLIKNTNLENNQNKIGKLKSFRYFKSRDFGRSVINSNYFDINNNNYYVNLFNSTTPKITQNKYRKIDVNKKFNSKENRNLINKVKYLNLTNIKNKFNQSITTLSLIKKKYSYTNTKNTITIEKMKFYRNKLLLEFMKYFLRFILLYKKKYFSFFINQIKSKKRKEISYKYIYKKKIQQTSRNNNKDKFYTYNNFSSKQIFKSKNTLDKKINLNLIKRKIINKIINNQSEEVINDKIRNVFIAPNNINKTIYKKNNINHSFKQSKENKNLIKLNLNHKKKATVTEIEVNFKRNIKDISSEKNKINLRFKEIIYENNKKKNIYINNQSYFTKTFVDSFSLNCEKNEDNEFLDLRKKYINNRKENKILSSILEVDEKISSSLQDSIKIDNRKK